MPVLNFSDINTARSQGKIGALLTVEGGDVLKGTCIIFEFYMI